MLTKNIKIEMNSTITFASQESMDAFMKASDEQFNSFIGVESAQPDGTVLKLDTFSFILSEKD